MSKEIIGKYVFNPAARTVTFADFDRGIDLGRLAMITNVTTSTVIFNFVDPAKSATVVGNVLTLTYNTSGMSSTDNLRIDYTTKQGDDAYSNMTVSNTRSKFRDGFATTTVTQPDPAVWDLTNEDASHIITQGGDSSGASYLRISLSPFLDNTGVTLVSKKSFEFPMRVGFGVSISQRILGQEVYIGMAGVDANNNVEYISTLPDKVLTGATASITSNVATFTLANHGLKGNDRIEIEYCVDKRLNVGPVTVTVVDANTFTVPCTLTNGSYNSTNGIVRFVDPMRYAKNSAGLLFENSTSTNGSFVSRRNGAKFRSLNSTVATTNATQTSTSPYTDAFNAGSNQELVYTMDEVSFRSWAADSNGGTNGNGKFTQGIPDEDPSYKIIIRAGNLTGLTMPVAKIANIVKTTTTTATVTTTAPHGLAVTDFVQIYGVKDQTNFPGLGTQTAISSIIDATNFTIVIGATTTGTSSGGAIWQVQGSVLAPGVLGQAVQSVSRTNGVMTVIGSGNWATPLVGEFMHLWGMDAAAAYEGAYRVLRVSTTTLELAAPGPDFGSISTGGAVIRRTDVRLHFARVLDYTRLGVEILGGKGNTSDVNNAAPVAIVGAPSLSVIQSSGSSGTTWNAAGWAGSLVGDVASAAITTTATTSAITPGVSPNIGVYAHSFNVVVTAVSGATPTMDVGVEESMDNGTNWVRVYDFPRITANGAYTSPLIRAQYGTRYRYVQTLGGTTPSFTRAINRVQFSVPGQLHRQFFDRSIVLTTLNSTTPSYIVDGCSSIQTIVNIGAATTAPILQLQGSEDSVNWYSIGTTFTPAASSTTTTFNTNIMPKFVRVLVQTAGSTVTAGYVSIKATGA